MEEGASNDRDDTALLELTDYVHRKLVAVVSGKVNPKHFNCHQTEEDTAKVMVHPVNTLISDGNCKSDNVSTT